MNKFSIEDNALIDINRDLKIKPAFQKMLNNLLGIGSRSDNSIFTSSKELNKDLSNLISNKDFIKLFKNDNFVLEITTTKDDEILSSIEKTKNAENLIILAEEYGIFLSVPEKNLLENDFYEAKKEIITKAKKDKNRTISKWKRFKNKYIDMQIQTNSWSLYIGTMFIKVRTNRSAIYAPLLLKKVDINILNNNKILIKSIDSSVDINEKLLFLLQNEFEFNLPKMNDEEKFSFSEVIFEYTKSLEKIIKNKIDFKSEWLKYTKNEVKNQTIEYAPGAILTIANPGGGLLRKKLFEIITSNKIDNILDVDLLKDMKQEVYESIINQKNIFRITKTDLSQEKAIIGSLLDSSIIWGPPGTGKSQTICNIIANLMYENKSVIVTSEKKVALDVLQSRMGKLSKYIFFGLEEKNLSKKAFYKPFKELVSKMHLPVTGKENKQYSPTLSDHQINYAKQISILKSEELNSLNYIQNELMKNPFSVNFLIKNFEYLEITDDYKNVINYKTIEDYILENNIKKKGFIFKRFPKQIDLLNKYYNIYEGNHKILMEFNNIKDKKNINNFNDYISVETNYTTEKSSKETDEDFLDEYFRIKFRKKLDELSSDPYFKSKVKTFLKNCDSGYRLPHKFINVNKEIIQKLFNVFISTPDSLSTIINMENVFDYAIFDEASQFHTEKSIPFIAIADKCIIAGDDKQMRPSNFFSIRDKSEIIDEEEEDAESLLDFAFRKGLGTRKYMLNKNYRSSSSELMLFSSKEFYNGDLDVIDSQNRLKNPIEVFNVNGVWEQNTNIKEAIKSLKYILTKGHLYESIILLTLNSKQMQCIEGLIYHDKEFTKIIELLSEGKLKLRNLENVQGDEADITIISVAYDKNSRLSSTYVARPEGRYALNVALSRAKNKMVIFKSITENDVPHSKNNESINTFKSWLSYLEKNSKKRKKEFYIEANKKSENFDSEFEETVFDFILKKLKTSKLIYIQTQILVGTYKIDMGFYNKKTNSFLLGIEVDGYKYHSGFEKMMKDIERQKYLESKNYNIYRITELNWKLDPEKEINNIKKIINI